MPNLANEVVRQTPIRVAGTWHRHITASRLDQVFEGHDAKSRWGRSGGFPILHLGCPRKSVIVEAYRHLVDPVMVDGGGQITQLKPRYLVTASVGVSNILDLRTSTARVELGIDLRQMQSATSDQAAQERCRDVAAAAHQAGFHGLIAPAATDMGETLALFTQNLPVSERPKRLGEELWEELPADPRGANRDHLRVVR